MGYCFSAEELNAVLNELGKTCLLYAPKRFNLEGEFSDTDSIRYGKIKTIEEIELGQKSSHTFKEVLLPISQTLFFFTEDSVREPNQIQKEAIIFLRSCDLHAVKRLDEVYLSSGEDSYYKKLRERVKFILIGCPGSFENCFCVDMGTNISENYCASLDFRDEKFYINCKETDWDALLSKYAHHTLEVTPSHVNATDVKVNIPNALSSKVAKSSIWNEYDARCIACGRCNFSCPTCTCFTMQDIFYTDNGKAGERRRVWASCMVDGYTDVAGGGSYRKKYGERMRFKVLHKVLDYKLRHGYHMCVGCGRCDDVCPEYISFSNAINKLENAMQEVSCHE